MAPSGRISGSTGGARLPAESVGRLAPGIIDAKKTAPSGKDSSSGEVKITYGEPGAASGPRGDKSQKARADYRKGTDDGSFQNGDPSSDLAKITGGKNSSKTGTTFQAKATPEGEKAKGGSTLPHDVKDHGK